MIYLNRNMLYIYNIKCGIHKIMCGKHNGRKSMMDLQGFGLRKKTRVQNDRIRGVYYG
jgi:hypothetical protein